MSFKSLFHNTIGKNASQYTANKLTYIHTLYINKHAYTKRQREVHTNKNKGLF